MNVLVLSAMRSHRDQLRSAGFEVISNEISEYDRRACAPPDRLTFSPADKTSPATHEPATGESRSIAGVPARFEEHAS